MSGRFTIKTLVASSHENSPEGLSVLEGPTGVFSCHNDDEGNIKVLFECIYLLSCVKHQKAFHGPIIVLPGTYVRKVNK